MEGKGTVVEKQMEGSGTASQSSVLHHELPGDPGEKGSRFLQSSHHP